MKKSIEFLPAYDKRHSNPSKNYGIHGVNLRFILKGKEGAVQFMIFTNWHLPHVQTEMDSKPLGKFPYMHHKPMPADLGYHSLTPRYEEHTSIGKCDVLGGKTCYYDGSTLNAERVFKTLLEKGDKGVWKELKEYYQSVFGEVK